MFVLPSAGKTSEGWLVGQAATVVTEAELFPRFGSGVEEVTVAVFTTVPDPDVEYVVCTVLL